MAFSSVLGASTVIKPGVVTTATRPSSPFVGQLIYDTTVSQTLAYNGSAWVVQTGGLTLIKTQTIGTAVSSVTVSDVFSSTYDNYKITVSGGSCSGDEAIKMILGSTITSYYGNLIYGSYANTTLNASSMNGGAAFNFAGGYEQNQLFANIDLNTPFLTECTEIRSTVRYLTVYGNFVGFLANQNSYTAFTLSPAGAHTWTGGIIRVYGYANS